jgi:NADPH:quinone reductase-like Zn-dependent oxidoreductase
VILTSSSQQKLDRAKGLLEPLARKSAVDAIQTIDYSKIDDWDQEARKLNGGRGVDFVIEVAGRGTIGRSIRSTKMGGLVAVSGTSGVRAQDNCMSVLMKRIHVDIQAYRRCYPEGR